MIKRLCICAKCLCVYDASEKLPDNCCAAGGLHKAAILAAGEGPCQLLIEPAGISGLLPDPATDHKAKYQGGWAVCCKCRVMFLQPVPTREIDSKNIEYCITTDIEEDFDRIPTPMRMPHEIEPGPPKGITYQIPYGVSSAERCTLKLCRACGCLCYAGELPEINGVQTANRENGVCAYKAPKDLSTWEFPAHLGIDGRRDGHLLGATEFKLTS